MNGAPRSSRPALAVVALSCLGLAACLSSFGVGLPKDLEEHGVSARARILEVWDTGWTVNDAPVVGMKVEIQPADGAPFEATIEKTAISRLAVPQFQPGNVIPVRFDPKNPAHAAVDFEGPREPAASSGDPWADRFVRANVVGATFLPPPEKPWVYLGTADSVADATALLEDGYALLGASHVKGDADLGHALEQGTEVGAAVVVVYGHFDPLPGVSLEVLPFRRHASSRTALEPLFTNLGPEDRVAAYWGKTRPPVLGIVSRPLNAGERARFGREDGTVVEAVSTGSPAEAAGLAVGDVVVAIDGRPLPPPLELPGLIGSLAGRTVRLDVVRGEERMEKAVRLNPIAP